jgi:hypothetical protein
METTCIFDPNIFDPEIFHVCIVVSEEGERGGYTIKFKARQDEEEEIIQLILALFNLSESEVEIFETRQ